jgi:hypothetical protein
LPFSVASEIFFSDGASVLLSLSCSSAMKQQAPQQATM